MSGFDRELIVARSRAPQVCEIETTDCIHDQRQPEACQTVRRKADSGDVHDCGFGGKAARVVKTGPVDPSRQVNP
jgi:hypothetical protein